MYLASFSCSTHTYLLLLLLFVLGFDLQAAIRTDNVRPFIMAVVALRYLNIYFVCCLSCFFLLCTCVRFVQDREELFAYPINWQVVETLGIIQAKMRPWIIKKIVEYLGEEEKTLTEFILTKLGQRAPPQVCTSHNLTTL